MHEESIFIVEMLVIDIRSHIFLLNCIKQIVHFSYDSEPSALSSYDLLEPHSWWGERKEIFKTQTYQLTTPLSFFLLSQAGQGSGFTCLSPMFFVSFSPVQSLFQVRDLYLTGMQCLPLRLMRTELERKKKNLFAFSLAA